MLCEGSSIRSIVRMTNVSKNTISKLLIDAGKACAAYHEANVRDLKTTRVEVDEIWSFTYAKQKERQNGEGCPCQFWRHMDVDCN